MITASSSSYYLQNIQADVILRFLFLTTFFMNCFVARMTKDGQKIWKAQMTFLLHFCYIDDSKMKPRRDTENEIRQALTFSNKQMNDRMKERN